jgi:glyoxylase-like metal-dependent hydrolase (beta-lactamase superfamily II)
MRHYTKMHNAWPSGLRSGLAGALTIAALVAGCTLVAPSGTSTPVKSLRLYVFDCGVLVRSENNPLRYGLKPNQVENSSFADPCFLVVHPRGTLLWDVGIIPDAQIKPGGVDIPRGPLFPRDSNRAERTLRSQLQAIGYDASRINYLAISHRHADHLANVNEYAASTWLVQAAEHAVMFSDAERAKPLFELYRALEKSKTVMLNGEHDVFGDGSVVLKPTPGHTEGHQSLYVRLANTGPVLLSGDLFHYPNERVLNTYPEFEVSVKQTVVSRAAMEKFMKETGAKLWIQHDMAEFRAHKKSPAYYD